MQSRNIGVIEFSIFSIIDRAEYPKTFDRRKFVQLYNKWMKDPMLLELTASEPLTLEEEYSMQQSWCEDPKKCTFIILLRKEYYPHPLNNFSDDIEITCMCGDVNLFFNNHDNIGDAEIEIMIADPQCWRQGVATEALKLMMGYGVLRLGVTRYYAKIGSKNEASRKLFEK